MEYWHFDSREICSAYVWVPSCHSRDDFDFLAVSENGDVAALPADFESGSIT